MSSRIKEPRARKEFHRDGSVSRVAMGFAMVLLAMVIAALLFVFL